jgi:hypothetical protein
LEIKKMDRMSSMGTSCSREVEVNRQKSVPATLGALEKSLGNHHDLLMQLSQVLQGALSPERPTIAEDNKKSFAECPLAEAVMRNVSGVEECSNIVRSLLSRLEV